MSDTNVIPEFEFELGLRKDYRYPAAVLYDEAFGSKLSIITKNREKRIKLIYNSIKPELCFAAYHDNELVGIAGFYENGKSFLSNGSYKSLKRNLGFFRSLIAIAVNLFFIRVPQKKEFVMEGISVHPLYRGKGIGSKLLDKIFRHAQQQGCTRIRLDVIDTNQGAKKLYYKKGFEAEEVVSFPFLDKLFGFKYATTMVKRIQAI